MRIIKNQRLLERVRNQTAALRENIDGPIKDHPKAAIGTSFASGFALGAGTAFLFDRRGSSRWAWVKDRVFDGLKDGKQSIASIMTRNPAVCTPETNLDEVGRRMVDYNCGAIPIVEDEQSCCPIGIITDRDIICRAVALRRNPLDLKARDCMTSQTVTISENASIEECCRLMEEHQVRRIPVINAGGRCIGIISQADIATQATPKHTIEVLREVSKPNGSSRSKVATAA